MTDFCRLFEQICQMLIAGQNLSIILRKFIFVGGALLWYVVKYIVSAALAVAAVMLGIRLRKNKNAKTEQLAVDKESAHGN